ncbi:MAG: hypothetical protein H6978_03875 [Gammaproteobacteria bacterium]|nr:hypothetical protein [Gammaproteobacteria bacterium]
MMDQLLFAARRSARLLLSLLTVFVTGTAAGEESISLDFENQTLTTVLEHLDRTHHLPIALMTPEAGDMLLSGKVSNAPLDKAIKKLLGPINYILAQTPEGAYQLYVFDQVSPATADARPMLPSAASAISAIVGSDGDSGEGANETVAIYNDQMGYVEVVPTPKAVPYDQPPPGFHVEVMQNAELGTPEYVWLPDAPPAENLEPTGLP